MGDDGVVDIDRMLQIPEHAIGIERRILAPQLRHPFRQPFLVGGGDLGGNPTCVAVGGDGLADLFQQRIEHQAGIANQSDPGLDVLVEVCGVERRMDDGLALGHGDAEIGLGEGTADAEDHIGLAQEFRHRARYGETA